MWLAKLGKGMLFSVEQAFVGREEKRAPLKTPAWEARERGKNSFLGQRLIDVHWTVGLNRRKPLGDRVMGNHCNALVTKQNRSSYIQVSIITVKSQSAWDVQSHGWHVKVLDFVSFCGSYVREFELSHSCNLVNRIVKITHKHNLHVKMLDFTPFKICRWKNTYCLWDYFAQTILTNHLLF